ncbi:hypothetical protein GOV04_00205 [Candidatus Woesearchaeota archaeon]|nr:hypothetical protein [Candidatus Woesearchaeota archaeon]
MAKCPFCKLEVKLTELHTDKKGVGFVKQEIMYSCPHCQSILGISRGKWTS